MRTGNDLITTAAITFRPHTGVNANHEVRFKAWLEKNCRQWEVFEEILNDEARTRHYHARIFLKSARTRLDNLKTSLCSAMGCTQLEKPVFKKGIGWLYDNWEYMGKDSNVVTRKLNEKEEPWFFADPDNKYIVKHNKWLHLWLSHMQEDLNDYSESQLRAIEWNTVKTIIMKAMVRNDLDMPMVDALDRKCKTLAQFLAHGGKYNARQLTKETQGDMETDLANVVDGEE